MSTDYTTQWPRAAFIGFDRLFNELERSAHRTAQVNTGYPPYNLVKVDDDNYTIELAVAGFNGEDDIKITVEDGVLTIEGDIKENTDTNIEYIHKGISSRKFRRTFNLAEYVEVKNANMSNGILSIMLERVLPEEKKPRVIKINSKAEFIQD